VGTSRAAPAGPVPAPLPRSEVAAFFAMTFKPEGRVRAGERHNSHFAYVAVRLFCWYPTNLLVSLLVDGGDVGIAIFGWNRTYAGEERHLFSAPETGRKGLQAIR
jgi:hypothetical protein